MLQDIAFLLPRCFVLRVILPLNFIKLHHIVYLFLFYLRSWWDVQYKKDQVGEWGLQFPPLYRGPANISLTEKYGRHYVLLTKYLKARDNKQQNHISPKPYKAQHNEELTFHGLWTNAHLSSRIHLGIYGHQLQTARAFFVCPHKFSDDFELPPNGSE